MGTLVECLASGDSELSGNVAADLCNIACTPTAKAVAVGAGAVALLLSRLGAERKPEAADDLAASLGVLAGGNPVGVQAAMNSPYGLTPLVQALGIGSPLPARTALEVLEDIVLVTGPESTATVALAADAVLAGELARMMAHGESSMKVCAFKLCAQLFGHDNFRTNFATGDGAVALQAILRAEPPDPPKDMPRMQFMASNLSMQCRPCDAPKAPKGPPTKRQILEEMIKQLRQ